MPAMDLCFTPASRLAALIRQRKVSPLEVTQAVLAQIERVDSKVNAYCTVAAKTTLADARKATSAVTRRSARLGPLHGVPVSIKDLTPTRGIRTTWGSKIYEHHVPTEDGLVVERLRAAGAIVIGKTNTPEFGAGGNTRKAAFGPRAAHRLGWRSRCHAGRRRGARHRPQRDGRLPEGRRAHQR